MTPDPCTFTTDKDGFKAILRAAPSKQIIETLQDRRPDILSIASEQGWSPQNLDFLADLTFLQGLSIVNLQLDDVSALQHLRNLRTLRLHTYATKPLDLSPLTSLEQADLIWNAKFTGLSRCTSLRKLQIARLSQAAMPDLRELGQLQNLNLTNTRAKEFDSIWTLTTLKKLRLGLAPQLTDDQFRGVTNLTDLHQLILQACRKLTTLAPLTNCPHMRKLVVEDCGPIDSIKPLAALHQLEVLAVNGDTDILDADLSVVLQLPKLTSFAAARRSRYTPPVPELERTIEARTH